MNEFFNIHSDDGRCAALVDGLRDRDGSLWSSDPGVQRAIEDRLGWLDAAAFMDRHTAQIAAFAERMRDEGYQQAVLLGMGGSSLAPEVYTALFGGGPRSLALTVADSTSPQHVRAVTAQCERASTLFIVSSKSGTTAETSALDAHFFEWARARFDAPEQHFIAITDPGSPLQTLAAERGYRETFLNPADIGGRFSALSFFGLVPAALAGADLDAIRARVPRAQDADPLMSEACRLGAALGTLARAGRNKLTLQFSERLAPVTAWIEQLVDESTGKDGTGIVAIPAEPRLDPGDYGTDRCFMVVDRADKPVAASWIERLAERGHPVVHRRLSSLAEVGAEFYRWQIATAAAGWYLGVNPFDEPDVEDAKAATRRLLASPAPGAAAQPSSALADLLDAAGPGDYLAVLAYLPPSTAVRRQLRALSERVMQRTGLPCCISFGPRYLHSSGQLHKGGPNQGVFILITQDSEVDVAIPGQSHGFRSLIRAQAGGELQVLRDRGRRVVHLEVADPETDLAALL